MQLLIAVSQFFSRNFVQIRAKLRNCITRLFEFITHSCHFTIISPYHTLCTVRLYTFILLSAFRTNKSPTLFTVALRLLRASFHKRGRTRETAARRIPTEKFRVVASIEVSFSRFLKRVACPGLLSRRRLLLVKIALSTWVSGNLRASRYIVPKFSTYANFVGEGGRERERESEREREKRRKSIMTASASIASLT